MLFLKYNSRISCLFLCLFDDVSKY